MQNQTHIALDKANRQPFQRFDTLELLQLISECNNLRVARLMARAAMDRIESQSDEALIERAEQTAETAWNEQFVF